MKDCLPFRIYVGERIDEVVELLKVELQRRKVSVNARDGSGDFLFSISAAGQLSGSYQVDGKSLAIEIHQRPGLVSCGTIEAKMHDIVLDAKTMLPKRDV